MAGPLPAGSLVGHVADLKAQNEDCFPLQAHDNSSQVRCGSFPADL